MKKVCKMCQNRKKNWEGTNPQCFLSGENWNCATINAIRNICYKGQEKMPEGVDYQYCDDMKYATIKIDEVEVSGENFGLALWLTWYKSRGTTDALWILDDTNPPRKPNEEELLAIIDFYEKRK